MYKNAEGYPDPTAGAACENIERGFEVVGRITLRDKETGREYR